MIFGNWKVTERGIQWNGKGFAHFEIPTGDLTKIRKEKDDTLFYEWILLATGEQWLTQNDLYDLNYAFVYAVAKSGLHFDYAIFDATLEEQHAIFDEEDEEDEDL